MRRRARAEAVKRKIALLEEFFCDASSLIDSDLVQTKFTQVRAKCFYADAVPFGGVPFRAVFLYAGWPRPCMSAVKGLS
jgi:hypothetical protein